MSETTKDTDKKKKPLSLSRPGRLEIKKTVEQGQIRQSFSHGRSKAVTVEVLRKRTYAATESGTMAEVKPGDGSAAEVQAKDLGEMLTSGEQAVRARVLEDAERDDERRKIEAAARAKEEAEEAKKRAEEEAQAAAAAPPDPDAEAPAKPARAKAKPAPVSVEEIGEEEDTRKRAPGRKGAKADKGRPSLTLRKDEGARRRGKLTISRALDDEGGERVRSLASMRRARERERRAQAALQGRGAAVKVFREVVVPETITVQELANRMAERAPDVIKALINMGVTAAINENIDADTAELLVTEFGHTIRRVSESDVEVGLAGGEDAPESLEPRSPVVTVMGHVDHGKTSLLDALRETNVVAKESGGITQHIGAYQVTLKSGQKITFLDTPGHEAFTQMRARGAKVTDIVVLVVAADDGIMPQTIEAIHHAKAAEVPLIVAINKIDLEGADPDRIKTDLLQHDVALEGHGGDTLWVEVSAKDGTNLDKLEEVIVLQAELLELTANPNRAAQGAVVEAKIDPGRGNVATVLIQRGTLHVGDVFVAGSEWGRVRALMDEHGRNVDAAGPSMPVEVLGLNGTPIAGDEFAVVENEGRARQVTDYRRRQARDAAAAASVRATVEQMLAAIAAGESGELPIVIKADVQGSVEAIAGAIEKIGTDEVKARILHAGVGGINESDVILARASEAFIIGFNVRANPQARALARRDNVEIRYYSIIYDITNDVKQALSGMLAPAIKETQMGMAEVREVFNISKLGRIAGCLVTDGVMRRASKVRLLRDDLVVHEGDLQTLKHFKEDAREVRAGSECGIAIENYHDIQVGDMIECYEVEEVARTL
ncbi:MAG: translation initiation factor IF-2 [Alphaproteobacteria bacterium]|nr:translation initiation factor IF-2 [Pseudomonadota bacterium]TDI65053.1 MAG: translation initiation factor IF-2 [Alphaproteobacteria bacterium]